MTDSSSHPYSFPECPVDPGVESRDVLTQVLRNGARDMLARAVLDEVAMYVAERANLVDEQHAQEPSWEGQVDAARHLDG
jgi:hypothetical protein